MTVTEAELMGLQCHATSPEYPMINNAQLTAVLPVVDDRQPATHHSA